MSFLHKINAKFGNGSLEVKLLLEKVEYKRGEEVQGKIEIIGGRVEQKVQDILIVLATEINHKIEAYGDYKVHEGFVIKPGEKKEIEFTIVLPEDGPSTKENEMVQLLAKATIGFGLDARVQAYLKVNE